MKQEAKKQVKKVITAKVVSTKMNKTVIVEIVHVSRHPLYRKAVKKTKRFAAHVENGEVAEGDMVSLVEIKPMSKTKHFMVTGKIAK
jgi:small subunit ribosomal protein S17